MRRRLVCSLIGGAALAVLASSSAVALGAPACAATGLSVRMVVVPGSAGAGNISYRIVLRNTGSAACTVSGHPGLQLRGARGRRLPTQVVPTPPGVTAALILLRPGASAAATLRFSPDVPGPGEGHTGPCEPVAHSVRVTLASPGHGSLVGAITPATSVCEHGRITGGLLSKV